MYLRQILTLSPRLECSGAISAHATSASWVQAILVPQPPVAGITGVCNHAQLIFVFLVDSGFHHVGQDDLELCQAISQVICPLRPPKVLGLQV